jgi:hypothetical protein
MAPLAVLVADSDAVKDATSAPDSDAGALLLAA